MTGFAIVMTAGEIDHNHGQCDRRRDLKKRTGRFSRFRRSKMTRQRQAIGNKDIDDQTNQNRQDDDTRGHYYGGSQSEEFLLHDQ